MHESQLVDSDTLVKYPRGQFLHLPRPAPVGGANDPGGQFLHPALDEVPEMSEYFPSSHRLQAEADVASRVSPYVPLGHDLHSNMPSVSEYCPGGHCMQVSLLATLKLPGSHPLEERSRGRREKGKKESRKGGEVLRCVATKEVE